MKAIVELAGHVMKGRSLPSLHVMKTVVMLARSLKVKPSSSQNLIKNLRRKLLMAWKPVSGFQSKKNWKMTLYYARKKTTL